MFNDISAQNSVGVPVKLNQIYSYLTNQSVVLYTKALIIDIPCLNGPLCLAGHERARDHESKTGVPSEGNVVGFYYMAIY